MELPFGQVDILAAVAATVVMMILGILWYGPLFGKPWMAMVGLSMEQAKAGMKKGMILGLLTSLLTAYMIGLLLALFAASSIEQAMTVSLVAWATFILTTELNGVAWEQRPWPLFGINLGYSFVATALTTGILFYWPW